MERKKDEYRSFKQMVNLFYQEEVKEINVPAESLKKQGNVRIEPKIYYDKFTGDMKIEFTIRK